MVRQRITHTIRSRRSSLALTLAAAATCAAVIRTGTPAHAALVDGHWLSATTGNWSTGARWDIGVVPNNAADTYRAFIDAAGSYTVTLDINPTVDNFTLNASGSTFSSSSHTFTVNGTSSLLAGTVVWSSSTWNGAGLVSNNAIFLAQGASSVASAFANAGSLTIRATGAGDSTLTVGSSFANTGLILLRNEDVNNARSATLAQSAGVFQNNLGGVLTTEQGPGAAGATRFLSIATLQNAVGATININSSTAFNASNGQLNNSGAINLGTSRQLTLQNGADINHSAGTITIADGANILLSNSSSSYVQTGGALVFVGTGYMQGDGATITFNGGSINTSGSTRTDGQIFVNGGNLNFGTATPVIGSAIFYVYHSSTLTGNIPAGMTLRVAAVNDGDGTLTDASDVINNGTLRLANDDTNNNRSAFFITAAGKTLTNNGTLETIQGNGAGSAASRQVNADLVNNGTVNFNFNTITNRTSGLVTNNSTFNIASTYALQSGASFTQAGGKLTVGNGTNGAYLYLNNATGIFTQTGGTVALSGGGYLQGDPGSTFNFTSGVINTAASTRTIDQINVNSGNLNFGTATPVTGSATFYVYHSSTLTGNIPAGMTLRVAAVNDGDGTLTDASDVINNGTLRLANDDTNNNRSAFFITAAGKTLTNNGTLETIQGNGAGSAASRQVNADLVNNGTVNFNFNTITNRTSGLVTNNSTFNIARPYTLQSGTDFTQAGGTLTVVTNGTNNTAYLYLNSASGVYAQTGGSLVLSSFGYLTGDPGSIFNFTGGVIDTSISSRTIDHINVNSGTLTFGAVTGSAAFYIYHGSTLSGNIPAGMTLRVAAVGDGDGSLNLPASLVNNGIIRLVNDDTNVVRSAFLTAATTATLTNAGLIETQKGPGAGPGASRQLNVDLINNATVNINYTTITNRTNGQVTNNALFNVSGATYSFQSGADFNQAGGTLAIATSSNIFLSHAGSAYIQTGGLLTLAGTGYLQNDVPGATFTFNAGIINSSSSSRTDGQIFVNGGTLNFGAVTGSATFYIYHTSNLSGNIPAGMTLRVAAVNDGDGTLTDASDVINNGTLLLANDDTNNNRSAFFITAAGKTLTNNGTLETIQGNGAGSAASRQVNADLVNNGTVNFNFNTITNRTSGLVTNNSTFNIASTYALQSGASFTQAGGKLTVGNGTNGAYLYLNNATGIFTQTGGTVALSGGGYLQGDPGSTFNFTSGVINTAASTRTIDQINVNSGNLNFGTATPVTGSATFYVYHSSTLTGNIPAGMTLRVAAVNDGDGTLTDASDVINNGTLRLANDDTNNNRSAFFITAAGKTLTNNGTLETIQGNGAGSAASRQVNADLVNNGTVNFNFNTITNRTSGLVTNNSAFNIASTYALQSGASFTQAGGKLTVGNGTNGAYLYLNSASGVFTQTGGTVALSGGGYLQGDPGSTFNFTSGVINTAASTRTIDQINVNSGNLNFGTATPVTGSATFYVYHSSTLTGNIPAGMTLRVAAVNDGDGTLTDASDVINNGTLRLANDDTNNNRSAFFTLAVGKTFTNNGLVELIQGNGAGSAASRVLTAILDNHGTFNVNFANTIGRAGAAHVNSGTFAVLNGNTALLLGASFTNQPTGIVRGVGTINFVNNSVSFANNGTVKSQDLGVLTLANPAQVTNLSGAATSSTLTGGIWQAFAASTLTLSGINVTTNSADVTLSGTGSQFVAINSLVTNNGGFHVLANRNFFAAGALTNNGLVQLGGGSLSATAFTNNSTGTLTGFGIVTFRPLNHGLVESNGGTLSFADGVNGGSGTIQVDANSILNLSNGTSGANADVLILQSAGSLNLGANSILIKVNYANANFGVGNAFNKHANVTATTGKILADGGNVQSIAGSLAGGNSATPSFDFGNVHVGTVNTKSYQILNSGTGSGPSVLFAIQTSVNGGNITDSRLSGPGVTSSNVGPVAYNGSSSSLDVIFTPTSSGPLTGQTIRIANNFDNIAEQTPSIAGVAWNYGAPLLSGNSITFPNAHVGDVVASVPYALKNNAPNDGFSEKLDATLSGATGTIVIAGGPVSLLAPQATTNTFTAAFNTTAAGAKSGSAQVVFVSNGTGTSGLPNTTLSTVTLTASGNVYRFATSNTIANINLGTIHVGDPGSGPLIIGNTAAADGFSESLTASFGNLTGPVTSSGGPVTISAGATNSALSLILNTSTAGLGRSGTGVVHLASNGAGTSGLGTSSLSDPLVTISADVLNYAALDLQKSSGSGTLTLNDSTHATLNLGIVNAGATASTLLTVLNKAVGAADTLGGSWALAAPHFSFTGFGPFANILAGGSQSNFAVTFTASTPGFFTETATLHPVSQNNAPFNGTLPDFTLTLQVAVNPLPAIWLGGTGNWSTAAGWSTNPTAPFNGTPNGALYAVTINTGTVNLDINPIITSLSMGTGGTFTGTLNLATNKLIVQTANNLDKAGKLATLVAAIKSGSNGATWTGKGITSAAAASDPNHYGVGLFDNALLALTDFGGVNNVDANSLLLAVAHLGDANRNGVVDIQDLTIVGNNWTATPGHIQNPTNWAQGDLNLDGVVDIQDFTIVANNWQQTSAFSLGVSGTLASVAYNSLPVSAADVTATAFASVPEPVTLPLLALPFFLMRRRSRVQRVSRISAPPHWPPRQP